MNEVTISQYTLKDIEEGLGKTFKVNITESMVSEYAKITGDNAPIHMDEEYARKTEFGHRICHGMLIGSFFSRLVGMHLPGENGLLLSYSCRHLLPCYLNQELIVDGVVTGKSEAQELLPSKQLSRTNLENSWWMGLLKVVVLK